MKSNKNSDHIEWRIIDREDGSEEELSFDAIYNGICTKCGMTTKEIIDAEQKLFSEARTSALKKNTPQKLHR
jgi:hypothetical protein